MSDLIWLSEAQMRRIEPYFPLSHGVPRVDDRRVISGIIFVIRNGLRWRDGRGRPLVMLLSEGQMSDYKPVLSEVEGRAALMVDALPKAKAMLGDRGYDADWFRLALSERGIAPCIPSKTNRKIPIPHDRQLYRQRHLIENMSAICIAATVIFWL